MILLTTVAAIATTISLQPARHAALSRCTRAMRRAAYKSACPRATSPTCSRGAAADARSRLEFAGGAAGGRAGRGRGARGRTTPAATQNSLASTRSRALAAGVAGARRRQARAARRALRRGARGAAAEIGGARLRAGAETRREAPHQGQDGGAEPSAARRGAACARVAAPARRFEALLASTDDIGAEPTVLSAALARAASAGYLQHAAAANLTLASHNHSAEVEAMETWMAARLAHGDDAGAIDVYLSMKRAPAQAGHMRPRVPTRWRRAPPRRAKTRGTALRNLMRRKWFKVAFNKAPAANGAATALLDAGNLRAAAGALAHMSEIGLRARTLDARRAPPPRHRPRRAKRSKRCASSPSCSAPARSAPTPSSSSSARGPAPSRSSICSGRRSQSAPTPTTSPFCSAPRRTPSRPRAPASAAPRGCAG